MGIIFALAFKLFIGVCIGVIAHRRHTKKIDLWLKRRLGMAKPTNYEIKQ